jgi:hypothetical protein
VDPVVVETLQIKTSKIEKYYFLNIKTRKPDNIE